MFQHLDEPLQRSKEALIILQERLRKVGFVRQYVISKRWDTKFKPYLKRLEDAKELLELAMLADHQ